MANNFFNGFQPQNFMQQQQFMQPQVNNTVIVVPVQGESGANIYPVAAGNTVFLIDFTEKTFWIKATDVNGIPSRFECYEFKNKVIPQSQAKINGDFVSQSELAELKNQLNGQFQQILTSLQGLLEMKGNKNVSAISEVNGKSAGISTEVQRVCEQLAKKRDFPATNGAESTQ